jgi:hypothetical protein
MIEPSAVENVAASMAESKTSSTWSRVVSSTKRGVTAVIAGPARNITRASHTAGETADVVGNPLPSRRRSLRLETYCG